MKGILLFTVLVLAAVVSAFYGLTVLDNIVHGTLYNYGLQFSYEWANQYWTVLRMIQASAGLTAVFTLMSAFFVFRRYVHAKPVMKRSEVVGERRVVALPPSVSSSSAVEPQVRTPSGLIKCGHCGRVFAQPLRMLDFHSDRPRMVNICPFCNEVIPPVLRQEELDRDKRGFLRVKKNSDNLVKGGRKEGSSKEAGESEETVSASSSASA